ncbi:hypothetical protein J2Q11_05395 [Tenacibaculum finnmarkense genomovar finnmarkense]|uniref:hypothetical protein n=1 Tax=Tenacibaculum finnmarkense TaxID=2781243 RepID=UPI001E3B0E98|nr:hypothetical protein [Tenacibaculum finnmarkense]MCD8416952.1 hypothetical protein [Tenacibaculum finnmarkense genomovar finnmarkense]MCG8185409.1 hypothetical protein [Tenacibaculum finnmarkense genomovar finnmarkense]MCG8209458.1 hypothetical protein [Tenacibaculum finnmarkense genomovar finnmarkense]MCG8212254.1 hypothetical protein [Tenacibaculum finnmarkense genomovar finnmarkense]MCG8219466.1 hypothetical protein [Tenacibaculum finnmarkense genomovar finnmarkense]
MNFRKNLFLLFCCFVTFVSTAQNTIILLTQQKEFIAGDSIHLKFNSNNTKIYQIYCSNSYGSTLINSEINNDTIIFKIPPYLSNKIGVLNWKIVNDKNNISGQFKIISKSKPISLETYLGPPSIEAGSIDYTMLVVIPTDDLDNPLKKGTIVKVKYQFLKSERKVNVLTDNLIAFKKIYSPLKSGRMLISSASLGLNSKEYSLNIMPAIGTDFKLFFKRNHKYADGNQITTFYTSIIKDKNKNVISDGSFVDFFITNKKGNMLKTAGTTINGIAYAKMIHPEFEDTWKVKAYITGISESDILKINYKKIIEKFDVKFSDNNRTVKVGPLKSFMNQMIPDGLKVKLAIYKDEKFLNDIIRKSNDGFVYFKLNSNIYKNGNYTIKITAASVTETFEAKKLW